MKTPASVLVEGECDYVKYTTFNSKIACGNLWKFFEKPVGIFFVKNLKMLHEVII